MKQLLQSLRTGEAQVADVPAPRPGPNDILVRNRASVISAGTERSVMEFARRGLLAKIRPDMVRKLLDKAKRDGALSALTAVRTRLSEPLALGYSSAGEVVGVGSGITDFRIGDRVACGGGGFAFHAECVRIPRTLAAHIPQVNSASGRDSIAFEEAAFATIGSVALHGLRLAAPQLGETVAVIGLGVIGLIAVQLVRAAGCRCLAMDPQMDRCEIARAFGCDRVATGAEEFEILIGESTGAKGVDAVLVAAATNSSQPLELAGRVARDRGCVIAVGATGTELPRRIFYEKELDFKVSRAYGPGRYDSQYEEHGHDYPAAYVRWTEGRNLAAFLDLLAQNKVKVEPLISHRFSISDAEQAYELVSRDGMNSLAVVIEYPGKAELALSVTNLAVARSGRPEAAVRVGLLGAGNFVKSTLLPAMKAVAGVEMVAVCAASGTSAAHVARRGGFRVASTDESEVIENPAVNTVVIATRHNLHAQQVVAALRAGKHVFCEKPLCINEDELREIMVAADENADCILMVGFNRRFSPLVLKLREFLESVPGPLVMNYRVNAGSLAASHWALDQLEGGGRIVGECCHFVDLMTFLCGSEPVRVFASGSPEGSDSSVLQLDFANGSAGIITYAASGDRAAGKERLEVFGQGRTAVLEDFRSLELFAAGRKRRITSLLWANKAHRAEWGAMVDAVLLGTGAPIPFSEIVSSTLATFRLRDSLVNGQPMSVRFKDEG